MAQKSVSPIPKGRPPWAAYRDLMACHLFVLDKRPGVRPLGGGGGGSHPVINIGDDDSKLL